MSRLFWLDSPYIMEFSSWKRLFVVQSISECFDRPDYWMTAICFAKLWKTVFCSSYVLKKQYLVVLCTSDVMY